MSKERLEELHKFYVSGMLSAERLIEEVVELEQINEVLINQIKRYREVIEKAKYVSSHRIGDSAMIKIYEILDEALEES